MVYEENIPLTKEEVGKIGEIFTKVPFEQLKVNPYFYRSNLSDSSEVSRHGISLEEVKQLYNNPSLITHGFKRVGKFFYKYTLCYYKTQTSFIKVVYFFDAKPIEILNAMRIDRNLENSVRRKYRIRF